MTPKGIGKFRLFRLQVRGRGAIFLSTVNGIENTFTVEDILYVPGLGTNLLSVAAVTDVGLSVHLIETWVAIFAEPDNSNGWWGHREEPLSFSDSSTAL